MIGELFKSLRRQGGGRQSWTPDEVRELIDLGRLGDARRSLEHLAPALAHREAQRACLDGEIMFREHRDDEAAQRFRDALAEHPGMAAAHYGLSLILAATEAFDDAVLHAQFAADMEPTTARFLAQVGYCNVCLQNFQAAETPLRRATRLSSNDPNAWNNLGIVLRAKGMANESAQCFRHAIRLKPGFERALQNLQQLEQELATQAMSEALSLDASEQFQVDADLTRDSLFEPVLAFERAGELDEAIKACEALELTHPDDPRVPVVLARLYERAGEAHSACDVLTAFLDRHPAETSAQAAFGMVLLRIHRLVEAEEWLKRAVEAGSEDVNLVLALATALARQGRAEEAGHWYEAAAAAHPDDASISGQLAANLANRCRYDEAYAIVTELESRGFVPACKAALMGFMGRFEEAIGALDQQLASRPSDPSLRLQRAAFKLLIGDYGTGWEDYAYRGHGGDRDFRMLPFPRWHGESIEGKSVIVLAEQGLGDQIMFASCLADLQTLGPRRVVVEMNRRVAKTIERSFPSLEVLATAQDHGLDWVKRYPDTDLFVHLCDLPRHFRRKLDDFPRHSGYLRADAQRVEHWRSRLHAAGPRPWIGISWRGGTEVTRAPVRSLAPERFAAFGQATVATWVCLQYGKVDAELGRLGAAGMNAVHWPEAIEDLDEFAALTCALDLVITVCNTTVHYAGALGQPVWVLTPRVPEWRYGQLAATMPWYPSSTLFRQADDQNWQGPIDAICKKLSQWNPSGGSQA